MSDELSKQSHAKFEALLPHPNSHNHEQVREPVKETTPPSTQPQEKGSYLALRKELLETKLQLNNFIRDNSKRLEKEGETEANLARIMAEISDLRNRIDAGGRELENQRSEVEKVRKQAEVGELWAEIKTLKDRSLSTGEEIQKLKASIDEQNSNLKQLLESEAQRRATLYPTLWPQSIQPFREVSPPSTQASANVPSTTCLNCGASLDPIDRFCNRCGRRVASTWPGRSP